MVHISENDAEEEEIMTHMKEHLHHYPSLGDSGNLGQSYFGQGSVRKFKAQESYFLMDQET